MINYSEFKPICSCLGILLRTLLFLTGLQGVFGQIPSSKNEAVIASKVADGILNDCCATSVDRAWAVGDRGLILSTENGGRTWYTQSQNSDATLHGIEFVDELRGWIVGGQIEPYTLRSKCTLFSTIDGGRSWKLTSPIGLPRLLGLQVIDENHLVAWGDWSDAMQSSFFESLDAGTTWSARPVPCGHLQSAAIDDEGRVIMVDRAGRVFRSDDGVDFVPVQLPTQTPSPLKFCRWTSGRWWLGGTNGRLFYSLDSVRWILVAMPGDSEDHWLTSLNDIAVHESTVWVVGQPGSVIWTSKDLGKTWITQPTRHQVTLNAIAAVNGDVLLACGPMATVLGTRNGGQAWWAQHRSGMRMAALGLATTIDTIPWDILTYVTHEANRHAAAVVLHDQELEQRLSNRVENSSRVAEAASAIRLSNAKILSQYPVGWLYSGHRSNDMMYYDQDESRSIDSRNRLIRHLVQEIRTQRPDVLIVDAAASGDMLRSASAAALNAAIGLAGNHEFKIYSPQSGIENIPWKTPRTLVRERRTGGLTYPAAMVLKNSATILESTMSRVRNTILSEEPNSETILKSSDFSYRLPQQRSSQLSQPFEGLILDTDTERAEKTTSGSRLNELISVSQYFDNLTELVQIPGNAFMQDSSWNDRLNRITRETRNEIVCPSLLTAAGICRRSGYWNRWHVMLELIIARDTKGYYAEAAYRELMTHLGSVEVQCLIEQQMEQLSAPGEAKQDSSERTSWQQSSPFSRPTITEPTVQRANFQSSAKMAPIFRSRGVDEFTRLLARWPDDWQLQRTDPMWAWLIASRYRTDGLKKGTELSDMQRQQAVYWPPLSQSLASWGQVAKDERTLLSYWVSPKKTERANKGIVRLSHTTTRPYLDGKAAEPMWDESTVIKLSDPWFGDGRDHSILRLARDSEFLYVHCYCNRIRDDRATLRGTDGPDVPDRQRRRDSVDLSQDHVRIRIDIDRDYATWYEFAWDSEGAALDQCGDMSSWDPKLFMAQNRDDSHWSSELAIPLESLLPRGGEIDWAEQAWAISAIRTVPSRTAQTLPTMISDRLQEDQWLLVDVAP